MLKNEDKKESINKGLTFNELLTKTKSYAIGMISQEEFANWGGGLVIKSNLPLLQKIAIMTNLMTDYAYNVSGFEENDIGTLYLNMFFHVYLGGYLDITDINEKDVTYDNYDLLEPIFGPWIESLASRDIANMKEMIYNATMCYNSRLVAKELQNIDPAKIDEQLTANEKLIKYLEKDKNLVNNLNTISILNDPALTNMLEEIRKQAAIEAKQ